MGLDSPQGNAGLQGRDAVTLSYFPTFQKNVQLSPLRSSSPKLWRHKSPFKFWELLTEWYSFTSNKTSTFNNNAV